MQDRGREVRGQRFVIVFLCTLAVTLGIFSYIQFSGRGAAEKNRQALHVTAALRDLEEGFPVEAVKKLTVGIDAPSVPSPYAWRGEANLRLERYVDAEADFRRAIVLEPSDPVPLVGLGVALANEGKFDEANAVFDRAVAMYAQGSRPTERPIPRTGDSPEKLRQLRESFSSSPNVPSE